MNFTFFNACRHFHCSLSVSLPHSFFTLFLFAYFDAFFCTFFFFAQECARKLLNRVLHLSLSPSLSPTHAQLEIHSLYYFLFFSFLKFAQRIFWSCRCNCCCRAAAAADTANLQMQRMLRCACCCHRRCCCCTSSSTTTTTENACWTDREIRDENAATVAASFGSRTTPTRVDYQHETEIPIGLLRLLLRPQLRCRQRGWRTKLRFQVPQCRESKSGRERERKRANGIHTSHTHRSLSNWNDNNR